MLALLLLGCGTCGGEDALMSCLEPAQTADYYAEISSRYFDTMDHRVEHEPMPYSELVARWEWPPWLKLTAYTRENIESTDTLLTLYPSIVEDRVCEGHDEQPFGRCTVVFYYDEHEGRGCPIVEEFVFNDAGEVTWIEAWSDLDGYRDVPRLSGRIPGLGNAEGRIDLESEAMLAAAEEDEDVADFVTRANDWRDTWLAELEDSGGDAMWEEGCGW